VVVTMRTPGHDDELAAGFLFSEGLVTASESTDGTARIARIRRCENAPVEAADNIIVVELADGHLPDFSMTQRQFAAMSSCGICGKTSIEQVCSRAAPIASTVSVPGERLARLPDAMLAAQRVFGQTGGLHAAALFEIDGRLRCLREDVGRHNAVDKVI